MLKKRELIQKIAVKLGISKKEAKSLLNVVLQSLQEGIAEGGVDLYGFAKFEVVKTPKRLRKILKGERQGQSYLAPQRNKVKTTFKKTVIASLQEDSPPNQ